MFGVCFYAPVSQESRTLRPASWSWTVGNEEPVLRPSWAKGWSPQPLLSDVVQQPGPEEPPRQCGLLDPCPAEQGDRMGPPPGRLLPGESSWVSRVQVLLKTCFSPFPTLPWAQAVTLWMGPEPSFLSLLDVCFSSEPLKYLSCRAEIPPSLPVPG